MPSNGFADEYTLCLETLKRETKAGVTRGLGDLSNVLDGEGPALDQYGKVTQLRDVSLKFNEADKLMQAAGIATTGAVEEAAINKVASLKVLRHLYLCGTRGSQQIWVVSTPKSYSQFPSDELLAVRSDATRVKSKLADVEEQFSEETKGRLAEAMQLALSWAEAAKILLADAPSKTAAMAIVKRWFAESPGADVETVRASLMDGFKRIAGALNRNLVIITDMPMYRSDRSKDTAEAFVRRRSGVHERPRTIYIEKALFENYDVSVLHDMKKNWARVLLHECTHTEVRTQDKGYAFKGIAPGVKITAANAAVNADSWAFFAADCADALTEGERTRALNGTGGKLIKLDKNWI